jgi:hypothetical protein
MLHFLCRERLVLMRASAYKIFLFVEKPVLDAGLVVSRERVPDISSKVAAPGCSFQLANFGLQVSRILDFRGYLLLQRGYAYLIEKALYNLLEVIALLVVLF